VAPRLRYTVAMAGRLILDRPSVGRLPDDDQTDSLDDLRALVTVSRMHESDCRQRQVIARLDDCPRVQLLFGESTTLELEPGAHHLRVHNTLVWKNVRFTIELGEHLEFIVVNYAHWWTYGVVGLLGSAPLFLKVHRAVRR
jgi:hypothetical protein